MPRATEAAPPPQAFQCTPGRHPVAMESRFGFRYSSGDVVGAGCLQFPPFLPPRRVSPAGSWWISCQDSPHASSPVLFAGSGPGARCRLGSASARSSSPSSPSPRPFSSPSPTASRTSAPAPTPRPPARARPPPTPRTVGPTTTTTTTTDLSYAAPLRVDGPPSTSASSHASPTSPDAVKKNRSKPTPPFPLPWFLRLHLAMPFHLTLFRLNWIEPKSPSTRSRRSSSSTRRSAAPSSTTASSTRCIQQNPSPIPVYTVHILSIHGVFWGWFEHQFLWMKHSLLYLDGGIFYLFILVPLDYLQQEHPKVVLQAKVSIPIRHLLQTRLKKESFKWVSRREDTHIWVTSLRQHKNIKGNGSSANSSPVQSVQTLIWTTWCWSKGREEIWVILHLTARS